VKVKVCKSPKGSTVSVMVRKLPGLFIPLPDELMCVNNLSPFRQGLSLKLLKLCGKQSTACAWTGAVAKPKAATLPAIARAPVVSRLEMFVIILSGLLLFIRAKYGYYAL